MFQLLAGNYRNQTILYLSVLLNSCMTMFGAANGAAGPSAPAAAADPSAPGTRPGQKSGKVVFGSTGNRLLDKQLAKDKQPGAPPNPKPPAKAEVRAAETCRACDARL